MFDAEYYQRYYIRPATAVVSRAEARAEVRFVLGFFAHIGLEIDRFADVGAGTGWWAREFRRQYPRCRYVETYDSSADAARLYGHRNIAVEKVGGHRADLVVCRDVLRYLSNANARKAIRQLAKKCRGVLYLQIVTSDDEIDEDASDMTGFFRPAAWYLGLLEKAGFTNCGMGLFVSDKLEFDPFVIEVR